MQHDYNVKLPETSLLHVFWRKCRTSVSFTFFFHCRLFSPWLVSASISHFVTAATKFSCCSSNKKMTPLFFFWLSFAGLPPIFALSLSISCSVFQICGHIKLNTLDTTDTETISAFRFRLYWLSSCLCFTRRRWLYDARQSNLEFAFGLPYLFMIELFYIGMPVVQTDDRSVYGHVITKFSRMGRFT